MKPLILGVLLGLLLAVIATIATASEPPPVLNAGRAAAASSATRLSGLAPAVLGPVLLRGPVAEQPRDGRRSLR
jgi:hypothetical protein